MKKIFILAITLYLISTKWASASSIFESTYSFSKISISDTSSVDDKKFILYLDQDLLFIKYNRPQDLINAEVSVYNLLGQEITRKKLEAASLNQINVPLQNTCYLVRINYSGKVYTQKIIVKTSM
jgi:hypothetical protein